MYTLLQHTTARVVAAIAIFSLLMSAFPVPFFVAEAATVSEISAAVLAEPAVAPEYFEISYTGSADLDLTGWEVVDGASFSYVFGSVVLTNGDSYRVCQNSGDQIGCDTNTGNASAVWNNSGDTFALRDQNDETLLTFTFGDVAVDEVANGSTGSLTVLGTTGGDKIDICHATESEENPYNALSPNVNSFFNGHDADTADIIPPFFYDVGEGVQYFPGNNWTPENQTLLEEGCGDVAEPTTGTIVVKKTTSEDGAAVNFSFGGDLGVFTLNGNTETQFPDVKPGIYEIIEVGADGWQLATLSCDADDEVVSEAGSVRVDLAAGETITCEFGNRLADEDDQEPALPEICSYAGTVIDYTADESALQNDGDPVEAARRNPAAVETKAAYSNFFGQEGNDWQVDPLDFFSLGIEGQLVYEFTEKVAFDQAGPDLAIWEITGGDAGDQTTEQVVVSVSADGVTFVEVATITGDDTIDIAGTGLPYVKFVKLVDDSAGVQGNNGDGFDVDAITIIDDSCGDEPEEGVTIVATKIVCADEAEIPNEADWNALRPITADTAADWIETHPSCSPVPDWEFEWAPQSAVNPGDTLVGTGGEPWTTFGVTNEAGVVTTILTPEEIGNSSHLWFREVLQPEYLAFTHGPNGKTNSDDVSATVFCHTDVKNFDNYDRIDGVASGNTYYCVAWNHEIEEPVACEPNVNLLANASFEAPLVTDTAQWDIVASGTAGLEWIVEWFNPADAAPEVASLELHRGVNGWLSAAGEQHTELDADWQGPGGASGEPASVAISQLIPTVDGAEYFLSWDFSPRPNTGAPENVLEVVVDGIVLDTNSAANNTNQTTWTNDSVTFTGTGEVMEVTFRDAGTANSVGTLLDNASLTCRPEPEPETAQIKVFKVIEGYDVGPASLDDFSFQIDDHNPIPFNQYGFGYDHQLVGASYTITEAAIPEGYEHVVTMCQVFEEGSYSDEEGQDDAELMPMYQYLESEGDAQLSLVDMNDENWPEPTNMVTLEDEDDVAVCLIVNRYITEELSCTLEAVSDTGTVVVETNQYAVATYDGNNAWTATIPGALWVWATEFVENPTQTETYTFEETFTINGATSATLDIAADNHYRVFINGALAIDQSGQSNNFADFSQDTYAGAVLTDYLIDGENTIRFEVTNEAQNRGNSLSNPAGVLYKLVVEAESACAVTTATEPEEPREYELFGYKWNDLNNNGEWDEEEPGLADWTITATDGFNLFETTTDSDGYYEFSVVAGTWTVSEVQQEGWTQTAPVDPSNCTFAINDEMYEQYDLKPDYECTFGNYRLGDEDDGDGEGEGDGDGDGDDGDTNNDSESEIEESNGGGGGGGGYRRPLPQVAGATTTAAPAQCGMYLFDYMRQGITNDTWEVTKLQFFLTGQGFLTPITGVFDAATDASVKAFQAAHQLDVLDPWFEAGIVPHDQPTGWVYKTTRWKINNIVCPGIEPFPSLTGE